MTDERVGDLVSIAAIQKVAETISAPLFWYDSNCAVGARVIHQGTMTFVNTGVRNIGISAAHVYGGYIRDRSANNGITCQLGAAAFRPESSLIFIDHALDLATFEITVELVNDAGKAIHQLPIPWPPPVPSLGERVMFSGHVGRAYRTETQTAVKSAFASFFVSVESIADDFIKSTFDTASGVAFPEPTQVSPGDQLGGVSGGATITVQMDPIMCWHLSGIWVQYQESFQIACARPLVSVSETGVISAH